ncbi:hypothetical protein AB0425_14755, partial [Actinosynnema sp. NPDC051121]
MSGVEDGEITWLSRLRRAVPVLVASAVAVGVVLGGPTTSASADPGTGGSPGSGAWNHVVRKINGAVYHVWYPESLDPDDRHFTLKATGQIIIRRVVNRNSLDLPSPSEVQSVLQDFQEQQRTSRAKVDNLKTEVRNRQNEIEHYKKEVANAPTPKARKAAEKQLAKARKAYNQVFPEYQKAKQRAAPFDWSKEISRLEHEIRDQDRKATNPRYTDVGRKQARDRAARLREQLEQTERDRDRYQGGGDDAGGTPAKKKGPKGPTTPSVGTAKTPKGTVKTGQGPKTGTTAVTPKTSVDVPKVGKVGATVPKVRGPVGVRVPGRNSEAVGEFLGQELGTRTAADRREELYQRALRDPELRRKIIAEYDRASGPGLWKGFENLADGFTPGDARTIGPELKKYQALDTANKVAKKSNGDPLYRQAQRECRGYDTCVRDRVKKLRDGRDRSMAKADAAAKKSNGDPLYRQAQRECRGYDTCVQDRVKKLRDGRDRSMAKAGAAAKKSNGDPLYRQAQRECRGYDTCVQDRVK